MQHAHHAPCMLPYHLPAVHNLSAAAQAQREGRAPWALSFSYGRALQASVLKLWGEDTSRTAEAQAMATALVAANSAAALGRYEGPHPCITAAGLGEAFRGWRSDATAAQPSNTVATI